MIRVLLKRTENYNGEAEFASMLAIWAVTFLYQPNGEFVILDKGHIREDTSIENWLLAECPAIASVIQEIS